ncbi:MAG: MBL fold metallo-hydrolase [Flavobacteriaceae bacterium]|nr:MBL fold metallo-hydrolase [Flavobacteriaceae bacterium]
MKITFLGTGTSQGIPVIGCNDEVCFSSDIKDKRLRSSVLIAWDEYVYVIDCGPDFRQQMLRAKVQHIDGIIFTHYHADHTAGLDDIRPFSQSKGKVPFYAKNDVITNLKERFNYIFTSQNKYLGAPSVKLHTIDNKLFELGGRTIVPIEIQHGKLKILGFRFDKFAYITDAKFISANEKEKLKDIDVLVINALRIDSHPTHLNLQEAIDLIADIKPKKAYLTHISHKLGLHREVSKSLPEHVYLAYDGLKIEI